MESWETHRAGRLVRYWTVYVGVTAAVHAETLWRAAQDLRASWNTARTENARFEAAQHTQPDGSRTLSTPAEFAAVERGAALRAEGLTAEQLRALADEDDYMASSVYGKAVETDDDAKRVERLHHRASVLRALAGQQSDRR
ncbi:hypothetical protein [Nocardia salmonicida]|uniref:hypothetical protein n=1 Tax=Nocardia salmonicida TaxID=53431 RepID=UPI0037B2E164